MSKTVNIGIMGFGHIGRYIYENALNSESFNVKAISDIGAIDSLVYLLNNDPRNKNIGVGISVVCAKNINNHIVISFKFTFMICYIR